MPRSVGGIGVEFLYTAVWQQEEARRRRAVCSFGIMPQVVKRVSAANPAFHRAKVGKTHTAGGFYLVPSLSRLFVLSEETVLRPGIARGWTQRRGTDFYHLHRAEAGERHCVSGTSAPQAVDSFGESAPNITLGRSRRTAPAPYCQTRQFVL